MSNKEIKTSIEKDLCDAESQTNSLRTLSPSPPLILPSSEIFQGLKKSIELEMPELRKRNVVELSAWEDSRLHTIKDLNLLSGTKEPLFDGAVRILKLALNAKITAFTVLTEDVQHIISSVGLEIETCSRSDSFCQYTIKTGSIMEIEDASKDARFYQNFFVTENPYLRFYAGAPIFAPNGLPLGALCLMDTRPRKLTDQERMVLNDTRNLIQENLLLRTAATKDHLTGVFNRRFAEEMISREKEGAFKGCVPLAFLMFDIDYFKSYNDNYGHIQGDVALKQFASVLREACNRPGDLVARFGGEEFLVLLPNTDEVGAQIVLERIKYLLAAKAIPHKTSATGVVTFSAGAAVVKNSAVLHRPLTEITNQADLLLYKAKHAGRNQYLIDVVS